MPTLHLAARGLKRSAALAAVLATAACAGAPVTATVPAPPPDHITWTVFLLGDGGTPAPDDPVLAALRDQVAAAPSRSTVVFLGDNIYPAGLPPGEADARSRAEARLRPQLEAARGAHAIVFVPGNHDWSRGRRDGWDALRRQAEFIAQSGVPGARLLPDSGCPGPVQIMAEPIRVTVLDTQWWLHAGPKPAAGPPFCDAVSPPAVTDRLRAWLRADTARPAIVVGHHPMLTGGAHGGHFAWTDHLFPLINVKPWLWVPLPLLGSAYPLARSLGITRQDLSSGRYQALRDSLASAFQPYPPLVYAAGHEHSLQVLDGAALGAHTLVVSGTAAYGHTAPVARLAQTRYARRASGLVRLDVVEGGGVRLAVFVVRRGQEPREEYSEWLIETPAG